MACGQVTAIVVLHVGSEALVDDYYYSHYYYYYDYYDSCYNYVYMACGKAAIVELHVGSEALGGADSGREGLDGAVP
eukprot:CAMPEP_0198205534 /NCGR_PEP_ID=MMETSP1445-20131203/9079_1 /TAXON_ID=36898 /ORGANISM="Pyramimonas sp., Strain CCMP2087" /LENGTH=76 /DNA_ID=CAMNT_0043877875 /DNA_START=171 /DNA_END=398 /DNA_ORIENTATION=+